MSRHGYSDELDVLDLGRWRGQVCSAIRGKRGQEFLRELADAMDAMPEKWLIVGELIDSDGDCCTIGVVCKSRGIDVSKVDPDEPEQVGAIVNIARQMAAEIEYENDDGGWNETPEKRWQRMRRWVDRHLKSEPTEASHEPA